VTERIVLIDDHDVVRIGLQTLLQDHGLELAGHASTGTGGLALVQSLQPDLALVDVRLPDMSGIELCKSVRKVSPSTRIAILTACVDKSVVYTCLQAGVQGYLLKDMPGEELFRSIRMILDGKCVLDPTVTGYALNWIESSKATDGSRIHQSGNRKTPAPVGKHRESHRQRDLSATGRQEPGGGRDGSPPTRPLIMPIISAPVTCIRFPAATRSTLRDPAGIVIPLRFCASHDAAPGPHQTFARSNPWGSSERKWGPTFRMGTDVAPAESRSTSAW
jgi:DNA-binding NarL/FixJ family response regulator